MNRVFKYETPAWGAKAICFAYFLISGIFLLCFWTYDVWAGNAPSALKYALFIMGLVFLLVSLKPSNWKGWVYFLADDDGIHFPSSPSQSEASANLDVSWEHVGNIQREKLYGGVYGLSIEVKIPQQVANGYFSNVARANKVLGFNQMRGEYFVIAYANNAFQSLPDVVNQLLKIKGENTP
ncbi:hypothetical protein KJ365_02800 [Glaciecola sp. XM2]|jgi:hypothetical protein|uniref:hypothetical protein n=1 Tax=Glaciecola sp. XM2 TaxID=1914931 RepID=UPI001BDE2355|nr:hypothetical protein [Glaciecola sp. XM2]MBT1449795.1 hypothetical protein [Glaciecola sp. XM2]